MKILSIIIPMYNMEKYIVRCLDSLVAIKTELLQNLEILVINDGSKDRSLEIASVYQEKYPYSVRVVDKTNGNYGSCINRGLSEATGKYIKVLDADDSFCTSNLADFILSLRDLSDVDVIVTDYVKSYVGNTNSENITFDLPTKQLLSLDKQEVIKKIYGIQMHAITYRTQLLKDIGYKQTEGISYTDQEWCYFPMKYAKNLYYFNLGVYDYLLGREGQTMSLDSQIKTFNNLLKVANVMFEDFIKIVPNKVIGVRYGYLQHRVLIKYKDIYRLLLLEFPNRAFTKKLFFNIDNYIRQKNKKLYKLIGILSIYKRWLPIPHVLLYRLFHIRLYNFLPK